MSDEAPRPLDDEVRRRVERRRHWAREGERPLARNLAMVGVLGWLFVVPMLLGIAAGRWLDARLGTGIEFTAAGLVLGLAGGVATACQRLREA